MPLEPVVMPFISGRSFDLVCREEKVVRYRPALFIVGEALAHTEFDDHAEVNEPRFFGDFTLRRP